VRRTVLSEVEKATGEFISVLAHHDLFLVDAETLRDAVKGMDVALWESCFLIEGPFIVGVDVDAIVAEIVRRLRP
jgi:hypothetical protein